MPRTSISFGSDLDGIFAASDSLAAICLVELRERSMRVPQDIKIVGFDDLPIAAQTLPLLTTVRQDIAGGAKCLVQLLLRRLKGEDTESLVLPPRLVIRETA